MPFTGPDSVVEGGKRFVGPDSVVDNSSVGELRRREGQGEVAATKPTDLTVGELRRREGQGEIQADKPNDMSTLGGFGYPDENGPSFSADPEVFAKQKLGAQQGLALAARVVPAAVASITGVGGIAGAAIMAGSLGGGEALGEAIEKSAGLRDKMDTGAILGSTATGAIPIPKPAASWLGSLLKPSISSALMLAAHSAGKTAGDAFDKHAEGKPVSGDDLIDTAVNDIADNWKAFAVGGAIATAVPFVAAGFRTAPEAFKGNAAKTFLAEVHADHVFERVRRDNEDTLKKIDWFAKTPEAKQLAKQLSPEIAKYTRLDPAQIPEVIADALVKRTSQTGVSFDEAFVNAMRSSVGDLTAQEESVIRSVGKIYQDEALARVPKAPVSLSQTAEDVKGNIQDSLASFKADMKAKYAAIKSDPLMDDHPSVMTSPGFSPTGGFSGAGPSFTKSKSINELLQDRTDQFSNIKFGAPTKSAPYEEWQKLDAIQQEIDSRLSSLPPGSTLKKDLEAANTEYKSGMNRYRPSFVDSVLRETGEDGGIAGSLFTKLKGPEGITRLNEIKDAAQSNWGTIKPKLGQVVYETLRGGGSASEFADNVLKAYKSPNSSLYQREVIEEFLPGMNAAKAEEIANSIKSENWDFARQFRDAIDNGTPLLRNATTDSIIDWANSAKGQSSAEFQAALGTHAPGTLEDMRNLLMARTIMRAGGPQGDPLSRGAIMESASKDKRAYELAFGSSAKTDLEALATLVDLAASRSAKGSAGGLFLSTVGAIGKGIQAASGNPLAIGSQMIMGASQGQRVQTYAESFLKSRMLSVVVQDPKLRAIAMKPFNDTTYAEQQFFKERVKKMIPVILSKQSTSETLNPSTFETDSR